MAMQDIRPWYEREAPWMPTLAELGAAGCVACGRTYAAMRETGELPVQIQEIAKAGFEHGFCRTCRMDFRRCALGLARSVFVRAREEAKSGS